MNDPSSQLASQPVEQLPIPLFDGVVLAARAQDGAIYLALRDLCATLGLTLRAQQRRIRANEALHLTQLRIQDGGQFRTLDFLLLDDVPIWIMDIQSRRVSEAVRDRFVYIKSYYGLTPAALMADQDAAVPIVAAIDEASAAQLVYLTQMLDKLVETSPH